MNPHSQLITETLYTATLLIYIWQMNPPGQSSTEALHTITLLIYIEKGDESPWSINHRGLAYCYTADIYIYCR